MFVYKQKPLAYVLLIAINLFDRTSLTAVLLNFIMIMFMNALS